MRFRKRIELTEFLQKYLPSVDYQLEGKTAQTISGLGVVSHPFEGCCCFAETPSVLTALMASQCAAIVVKRTLLPTIKKGSVGKYAFIIVDNPSRRFSEILACFPAM